MIPENEKAQAVNGVGQAVRRRRADPAEFRIEALPGGFVVMSHDGTYNDGQGPDREVIPNVDALVSVVQRWAHSVTGR